MNSSETLQDLQKTIARQKQSEAKSEPEQSCTFKRAAKSSAGCIHAGGTSELDPASSQGDHLCNDPLTQKTERNICFFQYFAGFPPFEIVASADFGLMVSSSTGVQGRSISLGKWGFSVNYENLTQMNLVPI